MISKRKTKAEKAKEDEQWEVDSDELDNDFDSDEDEKVKAKPKKKKAATQKQGRKFKHEVDTNIMRIDLSVLKEDVDMATGDPIFCKLCKGVFNSLSKLDEDAIPEENESGEDTGNKIWN